jgi:dihydropyrimidinase
MQGPWKASWPAYFFDDGSIYSVFQSVAKLGPPAIALLHCENWEIAQVLQKQLMDAGRTDMGAWDDRSPAFSEVGHARTYLYYARIAGCPIYVVHCTTKETIAEIEKAKAEGLTVYSEIGTHYLVLHKDAWKINVPLRDRSTHEGLWQALASGAIDCIGSDHVAHTRTRESMETGNVWTTISGFPSRVEGMLPMMLSEGVSKGRITIERLAQVASENPARIFGLYPRKGAIVPGADADLIVVDLKRRATITKELLHTVTPWSIYEGWEVTGWPVMTLVRGHIVMEWPEDAYPGRRSRMTRRGSISGVKSAAERRSSNFRNDRVLSRITQPRCLLQFRNLPDQYVIMRVEATGKVTVDHSGKSSKVHHQQQQIPRKK